MHEKFINQIKKDEKNIIEEIFKKTFFIILHYFYQKNYIKASQNVNDKIVKHVNNALIELKKEFNLKKILPPPKKKKKKKSILLKKSWNLINNKKDFLRTWLVWRA